MGYRLYIAGRDAMEKMDRKGNCELICVRPRNLKLRYILDPADVYGPDFPGETFRVLKEKEIARLGEYRTRRLVLEAWDRLDFQPGQGLNASATELPVSKEEN